MEDRFEALERRAVAEDDGAERTAVDARLQAADVHRLARRDERKHLPERPERSRPRRPGPADAHDRRVAELLTDTC